MKLIKLTMAVLAIASTPLFAGSGNAEEAHITCRTNPGGEWPINPPAYVVRNCAFCHGDANLEGRGVAPRLAGQHQEYIVIQFERLLNGTRNNPFSLQYMTPAARQILPDSWCELGAYISTLPPVTIADGNPDPALRAIGEDIFLHGVPEDDVPACQFCHGPQAQGIGRFPLLGGQSYYYLKRRLVQWIEGYSPTSPNMPKIAAHLNPDQIEAVTSYLSFVQYTATIQETGNHP
ncbi:MAG: cytochrome C [Rhodomicrobium sp.]